MLLLSNLRGILVRGLDGSGWLVSHGCRGFDSPFVGIIAAGILFFGGAPSKVWAGRCCQTFSLPKSSMMWCMKLVMESYAVFVQHRQYGILSAAGLVLVIITSIARIFSSFTRPVVPEVPSLSNWPINCSLHEFRLGAGRSVHIDRKSVV